MTDLENSDILSEEEYSEAYDQYGDEFKAGMGAEAVKLLCLKSLILKKRFES